MDLFGLITRTQNHKSLKISSSNSLLNNTGDGEFHLDLMHGGLMDFQKKSTNMC